MSRFAQPICRWLLSLPLLVGCGQNAYTLSGQNPVLLGQQQTIALRNNELQARANSLDQNNQQLQASLAQKQQKVQILADQLTAVQDQLRSVTSQLTQARRDNQDLEQRTKAMAASVSRRGGAKIQANNSLTRDLAIVHLPDIEVRQDGDVVRIELPGEKLFFAGSATLAPGAAQLIDSVAADVLRNYPRQRIGIEGHTDSDRISSREYPSNHHLSIARATAVYNELTGRLRFSPRQLFVIGHGSNHPVVSNASPAGKARNRRVELVIYPETYGPN